MIGFTIEEYDEYTNIMHLRGDLLSVEEGDEYFIRFSLCLDKVYKYGICEETTPEERERIKKYIIATLEKVFGTNILVGLGDLDEY